MTTIVQNGLTVDGVDLNSWAYNVQARSGRYDFASPRLPLVPVPGRQGQLKSGYVKSDPGVVVLDMWVRGTDETNATPVVTGDAGRDWNIQFELNMDKIHRLFTKQYAPLHLVQTKYDGTVRECYAWLANSAKVDIGGKLAMAQLSLELIVPDCWWQDSSITTSATYAMDSTAKSVTAFAGATAPMEDLGILISGSGTNPAITDQLTGIYVQWLGTLSSQDLSIDCSTFRAWRNSSGTGYATSGTEVTEFIVHGGSNPFFVLTPPVTGNPTVIGTGTSMSATMNFRGRRKYHS